MKKRISFLMTMMLICSFLLMGCSKDKGESVFVGTWTLLSVSEESTGLEITGDQLTALGMENFTIELKKDGSLVATIGTETEEGTYTVEGTTATLTVDGSSLTGELKDNQITIADSGAKIVLEKSK